MISPSHRQRVQDLLNYENICETDPSSSSSILGSGKYGKVYRVNDSSVKKECKIRSRENTLKQAFREHVVGILQTLLVTSSYTPHLPIHFDACMHIDLEKSLTGHMYMESFTGSLQDIGAEVLLNPWDWINLSFQVLSGVVILADLLLLTHNDLYPRNILLKKCVSAKKVKYKITKETYILSWSFLAVITDFGISSSSEFMGQCELPEVTQSLNELQVPEKFGSVHNKCHILQFKKLPIFSRDLYTFFKAIHFGSKKMPEIPQEAEVWTGRCLDYLDSHQHEFKESTACLDFFHCIFASKFFDDCGQKPIYEQVFLNIKDGSDDIDIFSYSASEADRVFILQEAEHLIQKIPIVKDERVHKSTQKNT